MDKKVIVIGLDGATWDLLRLWVEEGKLPHIKKMMKKGVWGKLESTLPPITGPAWVSFATGKNPGKHGCYDFVLPKGSLTELKAITTNDVKGETFYEILNENRRKCIIVNLPASYPPRIKKEVVITSILTQGDDFIFPPNLITEVPELSGYRILPNISLRLTGKNTAYIEDIKRLEETRFECAKRLFRKDWDFFFLLFSGTDWVQHVIYDKLISGNLGENSEAVELYREIDEYIGWFIANAPHGANILVMSDHGFKAYKKSFYINEWLREEGYLIAEPGETSQIPRTRYGAEVMKVSSKKKVKKLPPFLSNRLGLLTSFAPFYRIIKRIIPFELEADTLQTKISQTAALSTFSRTNVGGIYINDKKRFTDGKVEANDYEAVRNDIIHKLKGLVNTKSGEQVISEIWKKEEVYWGSQLDIAPDIVFISNEYLADIRLSGKLFTNQTDNRHALNGIFLAYGPDIEEGGEIQGAKIYDIAPTILHMFGLPIPKDIDGRVLKEIFKDNSELAKRKIKYQEVKERERIKDKMRDLKKIGKI